MRSALKKPSNHYSQTHHSNNDFSSQRDYRAKKIIKDSRIDRFGHPTAKHQIIHAKPRIISKSFHSKTVESSDKPKQSVMPSMVTSASHQKLERMLDAALTQADAHKKALKYEAARHFWQKPNFLGRHKGLKIGVFLLIVFGATIGAAWQKVPALSVKFAAIKTHVSASLPGYKPNGYTLAKPAQVKNGSVVLNYKTPYNTAGFDLVQKVSNMTSSNLQQTVIPAGTQVQTSQVAGNTVYIYGPDNDAAWVNNGVLYKLKDHSKLSSDQIIKIVQSMAD